MTTESSTKADETDIVDLDSALNDSSINIFGPFRFTDDSADSTSTDALFSSELSTSGDPKATKKSSSEKKGVIGGGDGADADGDGVGIGVVGCNGRDGRSIFAVSGVGASGLPVNTGELITA